MNRECLCYVTLEERVPGEDWEPKILPVNVIDRCPVESITEDEAGNVIASFDMVCSRAARTERGAIVLRDQHGLRLAHIRCQDTTPVLAEVHAGLRIKGGILMTGGSAEVKRRLHECVDTDPLEIEREGDAALEEIRKTLEALA